MKIRLLILFMLLSGFVRSQKSVDKLRKEINNYTYSNRYDSAERAIMKFLEWKNLSPEEIFFGHFLYADLLKSLGKTKDAINHLLDCKKYLKDLPRRKACESLIEGDIAECYFNSLNYTEARKYALQSVELSPDSSLRSSGHAVNFMMLGYTDFISKNYVSALAYYDKTMNAYKASGERCELPLCYMKIARVYNSMHEEGLVEANILKAIAISDSCKIDSYKLLSERTLFDIYKENKNYEKALTQLEKVNDLVAKLESEKQSRQIGELEVKYNTLLTAKENENLKEMNLANQQTLAEQRTVMVVMISAFVILCALVFFLVRVSNLRKKARQELEQLNAELEQKVITRTEALAEDNQVRQKLEKQLNEKVREMEILISKLSHDMRSPLASVLGLINVAEMDSETGRALCFDKMRESVKKLDNIIIDLTSTIYVSTMARNPEVIPFTKMIGEMISNCSYSENFNEIQFNVIVNQTKDFHSDSKFLNSILQNLIENAIKYGKNLNQSVIDILVQEDEKGVKILVTDNGSGIEPEFHEKIFDMFFRGTDRSKGTGLGLYIVKIAVGKLYGKIELKSEKRKGTTFTIYLPDLIRYMKKMQITRKEII